MYFYQRVAQNSFFHSDWGLLVTKAIKVFDTNSQYFDILWTEQ